MRDAFRTFMDWLRSESANSTTEYAIMLALILLVALGALLTLQNHTCQTFVDAADW